MLLAGKALTSTQGDWAAGPCGTPYQLFHVPVPCACPPLEGRISGFMSAWETPSGFPRDSPMERRSEPAHSDADNLLGDLCYAYSEETAISGCLGRQN